ncbi:MAG: hypothetical protein ACRELY_14160, partial [Polyangiaceae bacterium]
VPKVKQVLTGLPATDAEIAQVTADPSTFPALVDDWMSGTTNAATKTGYQGRMLTFFEYAFQQTQVLPNDFDDVVAGKKALGGGPYVDLLLQNLTESFARTALDAITSGKPFSQTITTHQFMMTPALMELYAYMDSAQVHDDFSTDDAFANANPHGTMNFENAKGPIPWADSINPASPNYMQFYVPDLTKLRDKGCLEDPIPYKMNSISLHLLMTGVLDDYKVGSDKCGQVLKVADSQFTAADFTTWKLVTIRTPNAGEQPTEFYDLATLRSTTELVLTTPRVGFFTTPAFFANWPTNTSNMDRAPMNQTLIVSTGMQIDGTDPTVPPSRPGLDQEHAAPGTACYGCHQLLDPTRSILQATYSYGYGNQDDGDLAGQKGLFAFQGVIANVSSVDDLASTLAQHPAFATGWVEKVCYYVSSQKCATDDPEFQRIVDDFKSGGFSWTSLVRELATSPITTNASETKTYDEVGAIVPLTRRDQLCQSLGARLHIQDICQLVTYDQGGDAPIGVIASGLPSDGYGRGQAQPVLPNVPTLFYRAGTENICEGIADEVVDVPTGSQIAGSIQFSSTDPNAAITSIVNGLIGLPPSDPRTSQAESLLQAHYQSALGTGASPTDSLKSTFVVACLSPSVVGTGM